MQEDALFAYFLGAFLGDGHCTYKRRIKTRTMVSCGDKEIITRCYFAVLERYGEEFRGKLYVRPPRKGVAITEYNVVWHKKQFNELMLALVGNYKLHLPKYIWGADKRIKLEMLAGLFDTDGSISYGETYSTHKLTFSGTLPFVVEIPELLDSLEMSWGCSLIHEDDAVRKPALTIRVDLDSAINSGFYFRCRRKQYRLRQYARLNNVRCSYPSDSLSTLETGGNPSIYNHLQHSD
jgi:hypothetical protein